MTPGLPLVRMSEVRGCTLSSMWPRSESSSGASLEPPTTTAESAATEPSSPSTTPSTSSCASESRATACTTLARFSRSATWATVRWAAAIRSGSSTTSTSGTSDDCTVTWPTPGSPESAGLTVYCESSKSCCGG